MIETKDEENNTVLENEDNDFKVRIAKRVKSKGLVIIKKDDYEISWGIDEKSDSEAKVKNSAAETNKSLSGESISTADENFKKRTLSNLYSTVEFPNVYPNVNLQYSIKSDKIKENIIIKDKLNNTQFKFNLEVKNLIPVLQ
ncbi:MAG: hypothetical protein F8N39_00100 [Clostridiaceae bacterium]|nr:hypothetical protein [Clostridiaceae bacterium]